MVDLQTMPFGTQPYLADLQDATFSGADKLRRKLFRNLKEGWLPANTSCPTRLVKVNVQPKTLPLANPANFADVIWMSICFPSFD